MAFENKAVIATLCADYAAKIFNGTKTIDIRKSMPKILCPFYVYVYCNGNVYKKNTAFLAPNELYISDNIKSPNDMNLSYKVIGRYGVTEIIKVDTSSDIETKQSIADKANISLEELDKAISDNGGCIYAWKFDSAELLPSPIPVQEFDAERCQYWHKNKCLLACYCEKEKNGGKMECVQKITAPPNEWIYIALPSFAG